ncbi:pB66L [African swine fever virus]|uniref:PB66L n=1 Tax=African swine fever virus TaxID=10497 RepID=A0A894KTY3_ASF|nr:pB66L [African swine fever virus]
MKNIFINKVIDDAKKNNKENTLKNYTKVGRFSACHGMVTITIIVLHKGIAYYDYKYYKKDMCSFYI